MVEDGLVGVSVFHVNADASLRSRRYLEELLHGLPNQYAIQTQLTLLCRYIIQHSQFSRICHRRRTIDECLPLCDVLDLDGIAPVCLATAKCLSHGVRIYSTSKSPCAAEVLRAIVTCSSSGIPPSSLSASPSPTRGCLAGPRLRVVLECP